MQSVTIKVGNKTFVISPYCYQRVGMTENMKFRLTCKESPDLDREFDDIKSITDYIGEAIYFYLVEALI